MTTNIYIKHTQQKTSEQKRHELNKTQQQANAKNTKKQTIKPTKQQTTNTAINNNTIITYKITSA